MNKTDALKKLLIYSGIGLCSVLGSWGATKMVSSANRHKFIKGIEEENRKLPKKLDGIRCCRASY